MVIKSTFPIYSIRVNIYLGLFTSFEMGFERKACPVCCYDMFLCYYMHFFTFVTEKDRKTLFYRQENDFDQGMACGAPICWSKYTTSNKHTLLKF